MRVLISVSDSAFARLMSEAAEGKEGLPRVEPRGLVSHQSAGLQNLQMITNEIQTISSFFMNSVCFSQASLKGSGNPGTPTHSLIEALPSSFYLAGLAKTSRSSSIDLSTGYHKVRNMS